LNLKISKVGIYQASRRKGKRKSDVFLRVDNFRNHLSIQFENETMFDEERAG
tara:strand:+ start:18561 stop:18716 length:156 start_codon:yes stop_codon:yes gene_type:complete